MPRIQGVEGVGTLADLLVTRRTHATRMNELGMNGKLIADRCRHSLDVIHSVYTRSPVESGLHAVNQLDKTLLAMGMEHRSNRKL